MDFEGFQEVGRAILIMLGILFVGAMLAAFTLGRIL